MKEKLEKIINNAHAPYSKFKVAALLTTKDGQEFMGVNVENASYGAGICAERSAIVSAITAGYKKGDFASLAVYVPLEDSVTPCFICRQVMTEFFEKDMPVYCLNKEGIQQTLTVNELCPYPFDESDLV